MLSTGCSPGVSWRGYQFQPVAEDARRDNKHMFVYFRNWSDIRCTRFEENVLKNPEVLSATRTYYCVALDYYWDKPTADRLGVAGPPGVALLDPEGRPLARLSGEISAPTLVAELKRAAQREGDGAPASQP